MKAQKNFPGLDGFVWWTGIVEDRRDPLNVGRVRIRMYGWHTDVKNDIPTDGLFWAQPVFGVNAYQTTHAPKEGEMVFGFFMDGEYAQFPFIVGVIPNVPEILPPAHKGFSDPGETLDERPVKVASRSMDDGKGLRYSDDEPRRYPHPLNKPSTSRFARNEQIEETPLPFIKENIIKNINTAGYRVGKKVWDEVDPAYEAKYPYNESKESESGHYFDVDDTRKKERITQTHRTGTMNEFRPSGTIHRKDMKHAVRLVHGSDLKDVRGNLWATTEKWTRYQSKGHLEVEVNSDANFGTAGDFNIDVNGNFGVNCSENVNIGAIGKATFQAQGEVNISSSTKITISAPIIEFKGVVTACVIDAELFVGDLDGVSKKAEEVGGTVKSAPACPTGKVMVEVPAVEFIGAAEVQIDEINNK